MKIGALVKLYKDIDPSKFWLGVVLEIEGWNCDACYMRVLWADDGECTWEEIDNLEVVNEDR